MPHGLCRVTVRNNKGRIVRARRGSRESVNIRDRRPTPVGPTRPYADCRIKRIVTKCEFVPCRPDGRIIPRLLEKTPCVHGSFRACSETKIRIR